MLKEFYILIIALAVFTIIGLAVFKVIKSSIPDFQKMLWILSFIVLNVLAAIVFVVYNDYILKRDKSKE